MHAYLPALGPLLALFALLAASYAATVFLVPAKAVKRKD